MTRVLMFVAITINGVTICEDSSHTIYEKYNDHKFLKSRFRALMYIGMKVTEVTYDTYRDTYAITMVMDVIL